MVLTDWRSKKTAMKGKNLDHIRWHFKERDPLLFAVLADMPLEPLRKEEDTDAYFGKLCREIISQQLGSRAAAAILKRFTALFPDERVLPAGVLAYSEQALRDIGRPAAEIARHWAHVTRGTGFKSAVQLSKRQLRQRSKESAGGPGKCF